jgi:hypothetical protein
MKMLLAVLFYFSSNVHAAAFKIIEKNVGSAKIQFLRNSAAELDSKGEEKNYKFKADFSQIEKLAPLNRTQIEKIQPTDLKNLTNEDFNQLYARLSSGPMFSGDYSVSILQKSPLFQLVKKKILKGVHLQGMPPLPALCGASAEDCLVELLWKGKRFLQKNNFGQIESLTLINLPLLPAVTLFPMNTYCGISQVDTRRESIISDASFADDFPGYVAARDEIVTRKHLSITEEYRLLRPGLYLGKVYSNRVFLFNIALEQKTPTTESINACFDGTKTR